MDKTILTPEESLLLIAKTIEETKKRFKENGHIFIFWGILMFIVTISQFILIRLELANWTGFPCFLYPLGGIYTYVYYWKKYRKNDLPKTIIGNVLKTLGMLLGANLMILGFFYWQQLGEVLAPIFLIFMAFWIIITGISIKFKPLFICGIVVNLIGFVTFYFDWQYHPLFMSTASVIGFIIPGILLNKNKRQDHV